MPSRTDPAGEPAGAVRRCAGVQRYWFSLRIALAVIVLGVVVAAADMAIRGFVVVHDPDGRIAGAALEGSGDRRPLRPFARGYWVARPGNDASIAITCRSGRVVHRGYATAGAQTSYTVVAQDCPPPLARDRASA